MYKVLIYFEAIIFMDCKKEYYYYLSIYRYLNPVNQELGASRLQNGIKALPTGNVRIKVTFDISWEWYCKDD